MGGEEESVKKIASAVAAAEAHHQISHVLCMRNAADSASSRRSDSRVCVGVETEELSDRRYKIELASRRFLYGGCKSSWRGFVQSSILLAN
jgi:hypothetical protein